MSSPAVSLIQGLVAGLRDGSLSPHEGAEVLEACAELIEELAEEHVKSWWARLILSAALTLYWLSFLIVAPRSRWPRSYS